MTSPVRAAVLSAGAWSQSSHLPALKADPRVELVALSSPNTHMAEALGREFDVPQVFADWRDALALKPDIVVVSSPPVAHEEQVIAALKKYNDMNKLAMQVVKPGGILLTCSCTGLVSEEEFLDMIRRAAFYAGRI
mgnify:CR=1 FL=1